MLRVPPTTAVTTSSLPSPFRSPTASAVENNGPGSAMLRDT